MMAFPVTAETTLELRFQEEFCMESIEVDGKPSSRNSSSTRMHCIPFFTSTDSHWNRRLNASCPLTKKY